MSEMNLLEQLPFLAPYISAFMIGLLGGMHCIGMCGGIMGALSFSIPAEHTSRRMRILLSYNLGRIFSYSLIGLLAGALSYQFSGGHGLSVLRVVAGLLLIAMGLYLANWWRGLTYLERLGSLLWVRIQPLGKALMPVKNSGQALLLGAIWGWLPCGLVYTALAYATAQANPVSSMAVMLAFGLGTLPMVLASGVFAERVKALMQWQSLRISMALLIIIFGVWTIWVPYQHSKMDHSMMNHGAMSDMGGNHEAMDHSKMNHAQMDHSTMDHAQMNSADAEVDDSVEANHHSMDHSQH